MEDHGPGRQVVIVTHASVMLGLAAAAAAGVGDSGGYDSEVLHSDVQAVDGALQVLLYLGPGLVV